ncbi:HesA/MoeB/ThiF family protein [Saccharothrix sp. Mg75]|uniref:HesA/MoeB/ThiF family protein n=1 Tax=Saccharothrix sp. Mg75 TaxID=3445357 RepID=UPI003EED247D
MSALITALDGERTVDQVAHDMRRVFPDRSERDVRAAISDLIRAGYVEDAAEVAPGELSEAEWKRYDRGRRLWRWMDRTPRRTSWDVQLLLKRAAVLVVGIGGVGSTAALSLVMSGVGRVHCVEPDMVELSNLNRQVLFADADVGRFKVDVAVERLRAHNSDVVVTGERAVVGSLAALQALAEGFDVVLLAADRPSVIRRWANRAYLETGTAWVHGGYHGPQAIVGLYRPGSGPCYECLYAEQKTRPTPMPVRTPWPAVTRQPRQHAVNAVTAGITGHLAAHAVMSLITGVPALPANREYGLNLVTLDECVARGVAEPSPRCRACGPLH